MLLLNKFKLTDNRLVFLYFHSCRLMHTWAWLDDLSDASCILTLCGVSTE